MRRRIAGGNGRGSADELGDRRHGRPAGAPEGIGHRCILLPLLILVVMGGGLRAGQAVFQWCLGHVTKLRRLHDGLSKWNRTTHSRTELRVVSNSIETTLTANFCDSLYTVKCIAQIYLQLHNDIDKNPSRRVCIQYATKKERVLYKRSQTS